MQIFWGKQTGRRLGGSRVHTSIYTYITSSLVALGGLLAAVLPAAAATAAATPRASKGSQVVEGDCN